MKLRRVDIGLCSVCSMVMFWLRLRWIRFGDVITINILISGWCYYIIIQTRLIFHINNILVVFFALLSILQGKILGFLTEQSESCLAIESVLKRFNKTCKPCLEMDVGLDLVKLLTIFTIKWN